MTDSVGPKKVVVLMDETEQIKRLQEARGACGYVYKQYYTNTSAYVSYIDGAEVPWCPAIWDNVLCWQPAPPGTVQTQVCPDYIHGFDTDQNATRLCTENGTWYINPEFNKTWTNYTACAGKALRPEVLLEHGDSLQLLYTIGYGVSLTSLTIAVFIMCCSRRLKSKSNTLHINLFLAFILRAALSFAKELLFVQHLGLEKDVRRRPDGHLEFVKDGVHWECRTLVSLFVYSVCVSQMWIFMEGLYLHMLIYSTLSTERRGVRFYVFLGWLSPLLFFIPWVIAKSTLDNNFCWNISSKPELIWILNGPMMTAVIVNFLFFLNILRVLISRVRSADRHMGRQQYRRLAKFILVLVPLFGVTYIIFYVVFPMSFSTDLDINQLYIEMAYNSFQGFILAVLFCFLNEEVHAEIRRMWMRNRSLRRDSMAITRSFALSSIRKQSFHSRTQPSSIVRKNNNIHHNNHHHLRPPNNFSNGPSPKTAISYSSDSGSDNRSSDDSWLTRIKQRAVRMFSSKEKSGSTAGMVDPRYDVEGVPEIDSETLICNGAGDARMLADDRSQALTEISDCQPEAKVCFDIPKD